MKTNSPFTSFASLGAFIAIFTCFALILAVAIVMVGVTALGSFDDAWNRMVALQQLENEIRFKQNEVFVNEAYYAYAKEYNSAPEELAKNLADRQAADSAVTTLLNELIDLGTFDPEIYLDTKSQVIVSELIALRQEHTAIFASLVSAYEAGDAAQIEALSAANRHQANAISSALDSLVVMLERERDGAVLEFPSDLSIAIGAIIFGLGLSMLLALWGYRQIARLTAPLLSLHDAASAIGADTFRPAILAETRRSPGYINSLALALENLSLAIQKRDAAQKQQLAALRQELILSRRRRLRLIGKPRDGEQSVIGGAK